MTGPPIWQARAFSRNEPATETAIAALDPDKYLGTLGTTADAPKGATKPHHTAFPASSAGGWLRVVSDTKIGAIDIVNRQEWICIQDNTPANTPANWELCQQGDRKLQYATYLNRIGDLVRNGTPADVSSDTPNLISWTSIYFEGCFESLYATDNQRNATLTDLYNLPINDVRLDVFLTVEYVPNISNDRSCRLYLDYYYPAANGTNKFETLLDTYNVGELSQAASRTGYTSVPLSRRPLRVPILEPFDDVGYIYALRATTSQASGGDLHMNYAELSVIAWK